MAKKEKAEKGKWNFLKAVGEKIERQLKSCPRCGPGVFMAKHADRETCGKCGYTEFLKK